MNTSPLVFLDSGSTSETRAVIATFPNLAGQTTNPSLIAKSPEVIAHTEGKETFTNEELFDVYKNVITEIHTILPTGDISVEVYADEDSTTESLVEQGMKLATWIPGARVKLPITHAGISAARELLAHTIPVNMTLCFSVDQALAVHFATAEFDQSLVVISPFVGRLNDIGIEGVSLLSEIRRVYALTNSRVRILAASIRTVEDIVRAAPYSDIMTLPKKAIDAWGESNFALDSVVASSSLTPITYDFDESKTDWTAYDIIHNLTTAGLAKFAADWNNLLK